MSVLIQGENWKKGSADELSEIRNCLCPNCEGKNAVTVLLPTTIPFFREIIIMTLTCKDCNFRNSEVNFGGTIQEKGERIELSVKSQDDLNRQLIKSDSATLSIPQLELEIPPSTQRGTISTLEGFLKRAADNLDAQQPERLKLGDIDNFYRCQHVSSELRRYAGDKKQEIDDNTDETPASPFPFDVILDDPAGNSFIENPHAPVVDSTTKLTRYVRTPMQDVALGLQPNDDTRLARRDPIHESHGTYAVDIDLQSSANFGRHEVMRFPTQCPHCSRPAETNMCVTDIPNFKEIVIMSLVCEECGFRSNEIKGGGPIPKHGSKITLRVTCPDDLAREVLKSDTAGVVIPELEMELYEGGLDGVYTTVEGLLNKIRGRLQLANPFGCGDSATKQHLGDDDGGHFSGPSPSQQRFVDFLSRLKDMADGKTFPFTIIISDPYSNSFVGPIPRDALALSLQAAKEENTRCFDEFVDSAMDLDEFERSEEQNERLGLNDMKTENYFEATEGQPYHGTDRPEELPNRLGHLKIRGSDHPLSVQRTSFEVEHNDQLIRKEL